MDNFKLCRIASERASWSFEIELSDLRLDFKRRFLPERICGRCLPSWLDADTKRLINQIRGHSYAHLFLFVEQFIIQNTCHSATEYIHVDHDALSALLRFSNEETKHQRMFALVKDLVAEGLDFRPGEIQGMEQAARAICAHAPFAVYLLILMIEWFTQRHYVECFRDEAADLDPCFVKVFRLHWTEEAQHARIDTIQLRALAAQMSEQEITDAMGEFVTLLGTLKGLLVQQDELDMLTIEKAIKQPLTTKQKAELFAALQEESTWTFILSGLEHSAFQKGYASLIPEGTFSLPKIINSLSQPSN
jgi:hypothetical protein